MKKALLLISLICICFSVSMASTTDPVKLASYFDARIKKVKYQSGGEEDLIIDFSQVQAVIFDRHGHQSYRYAPTSKGTWGRGHYWLFFKNGQNIVFNPSSTIKDDWLAYRNFLRDNPEFISLP